jgi:predicted double-glycine peptidase
MTLLPLLAAIASGPALAADVPVLVGGTPQGNQTVVRQPVRSWKAMKFDNVVRQQTDFSCGAAALATIFNYAYGKHTTEQQVLVNMLKVADPEIVKEKGFSLLDMKRYVRGLGMTGEGFQVKFDALRDLKVPGIALLNIKNYKHFVVIRKVGDSYVQVADPALGNNVMSRAAFEDSWNGVVFVVLGEGYDPSSALKNPPPPLSARRLFEQRSPVQNAEPSDFGIVSTTSYSF